jgi:hypothetical protein
VRIASNDPNNSITNLKVLATNIFTTRTEDISLNMGDIRRNGRSIEFGYINVHKGQKYEVSNITSSSEFISAREGLPADSTEKPDKIGVEITIGPGLDTDLLSESVTVRFKDSIRSNVKFHLYGIVRDDIEITPLRLTYVLADTIPDPRILSRTLKVVNYYDDLPLEIVDAQAVGEYLALSIETIEEGQKFEITATATDKAMAVDSDFAGDIVINTNNPDMRRLKVPFKITRK